MKIVLESKTSLYDIIEGFLFCTDRLDEIDKYIEGSVLTAKGKKLIYDNLVNTENPHMQVMNQVIFKLKIFDITRSCLQEFARHRYGNEILVKSTRFTIGRISNEDLPSLNHGDNRQYDYVQKYYYIPYVEFMDIYEEKDWINERYKELLIIKEYKLYGMKNDFLKKYVNDYMLCNINSTMSGTCLLNMFNKRLSKKAFYQFRNLMNLIKENIPYDFKFIKEMIKIKD